MDAVNADGPGYVYGITHPEHPGYIKIGKTRNVRRRLGQYQTADPFRRYKLEFSIFSNSYHAAELRAHALLRGFRHQNTEWFQVSPDDAFNMLMKLKEPKL
jgi:hypothetical protein